MTYRRPLMCFPKQLFKILYLCGRWLWKHLILSDVFLCLCSDVHNGMSMFCFRALICKSRSPLMPGLAQSTIFTD